MLNAVRRVWQRRRSFLPAEGFFFGRPLVVLQSDDWGRLGIRDREGWEELRELGMALGERSYDFYSFETADDIAALVSLLQRHRDSRGSPACLEMNFIVANVDFPRVRANDFRQIYLRALTDGLPEGWTRPGLFEAYREGISAEVLLPAMHGMTHFCRPSVERHLNDPGERGIFLRSLWSAGTAYIHWRMPWVGFEYWDSSHNGEQPFLSFEVQEGLIHSTVKNFTDFFSVRPLSACAPGYRANDGTHRAWAKHGIRVAQNGPMGARPPHFDQNGILHLYRSMDFEPASVEKFSVDKCVQAAENCFALGVPAIVSVHSINFHSTIKDFRSRTLALLDSFLSSLETRHSDLLYVRDEDLVDLVNEGSMRSKPSEVRVSVTKRKFMRPAMERSA